MSFVVPWGILIMSTTGSAVSGHAFAHAISGNLFCKACFAVPLCNTVASVIQHMTDTHIDLPSASSSVLTSRSFVTVNEDQLIRLQGAYYLAVVLTTAIVSAWSLYDTVVTVQLARKAFDNGASERSVHKPKV